ncbi:MAG: hypothetical protein O3B86_16660, partial [Planctomycetota bacterium]|nr:hypothetical protein [Planctomycetota bacterium]
MAVVTIKQMLPEGDWLRSRESLVGWRLGLELESQIMRDRTAVTYWLLLSISTLMFGILEASTPSESDAQRET